MKEDTAREIIRQCPEREHGLYVPAHTARIVTEACDRFFKSRKINYEYGWLLKRKQLTDIVRTKINTK